MRKISVLLFIVCLCFCSQQPKAQNKTNIPLPSPAQLEWQQKERIMFVHYSPATWQGKEYDNWTTSLKQINPTKLNTDQWCEVAKSWGAKTIILVAKHVGGFCWWQTTTTGYSIKNTPWKGGKGDVMKSLSESCKKYGLDLGVYVNPSDAHWGAKDGGITEDPKMQKEYNGIYRQQLTELLTKYGKIKEVWFDGNCQIDVADILKQYAPNAVFFQGKSASLRWVGNEDGFAPDPNWYTLSKKDLATGVSTSKNSDVNGDAYAPVEVDVPLMQNGGHKWFWAPHTDSLLLNTHQLMDLYYKSVGHGAVLLLNSTPDTSGLIPASHVAIYKAFGNEIRRCFGTPLARTQGHARELKIILPKTTVINHTILREDLSKGQRVKAYRIEGSVDGKNWTLLYRGTSIGNKKIDKFENKTVKYVRVVIESDKDLPYLSDFSVYHVTAKPVAR
jgi:alpha-L-fucosidase